MKHSTPSIHRLLRERLHAQAGIITSPPGPRYTLEQLASTQWSPTFERLMRNRMIMGSMRYGILGAPNKPRYDNIRSILNRLNIYRETGSLETLVDIANLCLCEFVEGRHPKRHWSTADSGEHVQPV